MVTADVVGLYPSIHHDAGVEALRKALDIRENKKISTDDLTKKQLLQIYWKGQEANFGDCHWYQICDSICMYIHGTS